MQSMSMFERLKQWAKSMKRNIVALYYASRDPRVPWYVKMFAAITVAFALSPIDLIPDFIPVLGYLDDVIFLPLAIWLLIHMISPDLMQEFLDKADSSKQKTKHLNVASIFIICIWICVFVIFGIFILKKFQP